MKALTILQPYATLIASGEKRVENRTWQMHHRGDLIIHAGKSKSELDLDRGEPWPEGMPRGAIVAIAEVAECIHVNAKHRGHCQQRFPWLLTHCHAFGPWCIVLENVRRLAEPIPYRGAQGVFDIPDDVLAGAELIPVVQP